MKLPEGAVLISSIAAWLISACVLLVLATLSANLSGMGLQGLGILSSVLSFLCAAAAGWAASRRQRTGRLITAMLTGTLLVVLLLTVGFLIRGNDLNPSSILSLVSFSYAGVLFGAMILYRPHSGPKKTTPFVRKLT